MTRFAVVLVTCANNGEAQRIGQILVKEKMAACANTLSGMESAFFWDRKLQKSKETLLLLKTRRGLFAKLVKRVKALHSYQVPEIIAVPVLFGEKDYLDWIGKETKG